jgi:type IV pilus assembly protein PilB
VEKGHKKLGEILIEKGLITAEELEQALNEQVKTKEFLGAVLLRKNQIKERDLFEALSEQYSIPLISLKNRYIDWKIVKEFSASLILDYMCFPIKKDDWSMTIAITNPLDAWAIKRAEEETSGFKLKLVLVSSEDMREAIHRYKQFMRGRIFKF